MKLSVKGTNASVDFRMAGGLSYLVLLCLGSNITTNNEPPFTCFASLCIVPNGVLALLAVSEPLDESIEWLSLELSLSNKL